MSVLYQYLTENYQDNEPFFLSDIQMEGMTDDQVRQQLKALVLGEKVKRFAKGIYYLPQKIFSNPVQSLHWKKFWNIKKEAHA